MCSVGKPVHFFVLIARGEQRESLSAVHTGRRTPFDVVGGDTASRCQARIILIYFSISVIPVPNLNFNFQFFNTVRYRGTGIYGTVR